MNVLLIRPPFPNSMFGHFTGLSEPLSLEYIAAGIKGVHNVTILDMVVDNTFEKHMKELKPDIVGCTAVTPIVNNAKKVFEAVKSINPDILTVVGGAHASVLPSDFIDDKNIDLIVMGEGIQPFKEICQQYQNRGEYNNIKGVYSRNRKYDGVASEIPDLDSLPFPDRELVAKYRSKYVQPQSALIRSSIGCPFSCSFCCITEELKGKVYQRNLDSFMEELATIKESYFFIIDDEFMYDYERAREIAIRIKKAGIQKKSGFFARADSIVKHPDIIEAWAKIGLKFIMVGLEAHNEKDLKIYKKGTSLQVNEEAVRILKSNNVFARGNFLVRPEYDETDFHELLAYVRKHDIETPFFPVLTPLPGTKFYEQVKDQLITSNYDLFDMTHVVLPTKLPLKQFYKLYRQLMIKAITPNSAKIAKHFDKKTNLSEITKALKLLLRMSKMAKHHAYVP